MIRGLMSLVLLSCAASLPPVAYGGFDSREARESACLDVRDHAVALYSDEYLASRGEVLGPSQLEAFRSGWSEELAKQGTFERFDTACMASLTPAGLTCAEAARTTDGITDCMRFANRP